MVFSYSTHLTSNILYIEEEELYDKFRTFLLPIVTQTNNYQKSDFT